MGLPFTPNNFLLFIGLSNFLMLYVLSEWFCVMFRLLYSKCSTTICAYRLWFWTSTCLSSLANIFLYLYTTPLCFTFTVNLIGGGGRKHDEPLAAYTTGLPVEPHLTSLSPCCKSVLGSVSAPCFRANIQPLIKSHRAGFVVTVVKLAKR